MLLNLFILAHQYTPQLAAERPNSAASAHSTEHEGNAVRRVRCNELLCRPMTKERRSHSAFRGAARINSSALIQHERHNAGDNPRAHSTNMRESLHASRVDPLVMPPTLERAARLSDSDSSASQRRRHRFF